MQSPLVAVLDLTSNIGAHALAQLGVSGAEGHGAWENIPLHGVSGTPNISWYRPFEIVDLRSLPANPDVMAILVGPGIFSMLPAVLSHNTVLKASAVWFLIMPNARMADIAITKYLASHPRAGVQKYQISNSDPQTLWLVFIKQLCKLEKFNKHFSNQEVHESGISINLKSSMDSAMAIDGALAAALVNYRSGICLAQTGGGMNLDIAASGNTEVLEAQLQTLKSLGISCSFEDIQITLADQYHLIRLVPHVEGLFLYLVLDRNKGNLALARYKLMHIERTLKT
ncbi:hypothetical protein ACLBXN_08920 [Comamonas sp. C24C]